MAIGTSVLIDIQQDSESTAGDITQFGTVEYYIAVCAFENGRHAAFRLTACHVVEIATERNDESAFLFVNLDVHSLFFL